MFTKRQKQILDFIRKYIEKYSYAPSLEEIKKHFKLSSVSTVHQHIETLKTKGYLKKIENQPRSIELYLPTEKSSVAEIPLLGTIAAGEPIEAIEEPEPISVPKDFLTKSGRYYALRVMGNSMIEEGIFDGDIVIVREQPTVENGETVVALINNNKVTLKKFYKENNRIRLQPANPALEPIFTNNLIIQGKVVSIIRSLEKVNKDVQLGKTSLIPKDIKERLAKPQPLFKLEKIPKFPSTRFQGSKVKLLDWIWENLENVKFNTALDLFGGTGAVGYLFKQRGKQVIYNDYLKFNYLIGLALIENGHTTLTDDDLDFALSKHSNIEYPNFVQKTFKNIYYTDKENEWVDIVSTNIRQIKDKYKQALAYFALFQACIIKRPYNLFHRKNLYIRTANVKRSFGNKTTWDKPFAEHFLFFAREANEAVFDNGRKNKAYNKDVFDLDTQVDLVYIDTPYISDKEVGVEYVDFYHFLEGLCNYQTWYEHVDFNSKHRKFKNKKSIWSDKKKITSAFDNLFEKFKKSIFVVSYRSDGIPSPEMLLQLLGKYKKNVREAFRKDYKYVLSKNGNSKEVLFVAE